MSGRTRPMPGTVIKARVCAFSEQGLVENYGSHSLRKTWGYHQRVKYGVATVKLMKAYGHSSEEMTLRYLGILPDEVMAIYRNKITGRSDH